MVDNSEKIKQILDGKKLEYKETEKHFQVSCPLCTDTRFRLGISRHGPWRCMNCNQRGKQLSTLIYALDHIVSGTVKKKQTPKKVVINQSIHIKAHEAIKLEKNSDAIEYIVEGRKLSEKTLDHFQLGFRSKFNGKDCGPHITIPYLVHKKCVCLKYRSLDPDVEKGFKWRREKGGLSILFNSDILDNHDYSTIIISESEIDTMSLHELGFKNVVGLTTGAQSFADEWVEQLKRFKKIYLMLDNDDAGKDGTNLLVEKLGIDRCYITTLPDGVKDPNEMLQKCFKRDDVVKILRSAKRQEIANVVSGYKSYLELEDDLFSVKEENRGLEYPLATERDNLGRAGKGHLIIIGGKPKCGKTTQSVNWITHFAKHYGGVGFYSCEMRVSKLTEKQILLSAPCQEIALAFETQYEKGEDISQYSKKSLRTTMLRIPNHNMYFYYPKSGDLELDKVIRKVRDMVLRYDLKTFFFDNLHFLCRGDNSNEKIEMATREFKLLAETLNIPIYLITHPKKTNTHYMKVEDLKGSSAIIQDADTIILMSRTFDFQRGNELDDEDDLLGDFSHNLVNFDVISRWKEDSSFQLYFSGQQSRFYDTGYFFRESLNKLKQRKSKKREDK